MTTPLSGTISLSDYNVEWGLPSNTQISMADASVRTINGRPFVGMQTQLSDGYSVDVFSVTLGINPDGWIGFDNTTGAGYGAISPTAYYGFGIEKFASSLGIALMTEFVLVAGSWGINIPAPSRVSTTAAAGAWIGQSGRYAYYNTQVFLSNQGGQTIKVGMKRAF